MKNTTNLYPTIKSRLLLEMENRKMTEQQFCDLICFNINNFKRKMRNQRWSINDINRLNEKLNEKEH